MKPLYHIPMKFRKSLGFAFENVYPTKLESLGEMDGFLND